jgi:hypothetical protein
MRLEGRSDVHLLHVTQTPLEPVTLVILAFWFLALVVVDAPHCSIMKEAYNLAFFLMQDFPGMGSLLFHP